MFYGSSGNPDFGHVRKYVKHVKSQSCVQTIYLVEQAKQQENRAFSWALLQQHECWPGTGETSEAHLSGVGAEDAQVSTIGGLSLYGGESAGN